MAAAGRREYACGEGNRMDGVPRRMQGHELPAGWASFLEIVVLAPLAAVLVLGVVPSAFEIEWECVRGFGVVRTVGDSYLTAFAVVGALGWVAVAVGMIYAHISERPRVALALPLAWFVVLVVSALVAAAAIGPATCAA
jgi:hypothetical protein